MGGKGGGSTGGWVQWAMCRAGAKLPSCVRLKDLTSLMKLGMEVSRFGLVLESFEPVWPGFVQS